MKIIFFGTSDFAIPILEALCQESYKIVAVITTPDQPAGRRKILTPSPLKIAAQKWGLKILQPQKLKNNSELMAYNLKLKADIGIIASYGKIIPPEIIALFPKGLVNIHPSLLPKYRGPSPIQSAILNGEKQTGITIMLVDEEIDHGPLLQNITYQISPTKYFKEIRTDLAKLGAKLLIKTLPDYLNGKIISQEQDHVQATFTKKLSLADGKINWHQSAYQIFNQIRALNPEPGTWTIRRDRPQEILKILRATPWLQTAPLPPGIALIENRTLLVSTGKGRLKLEEIKPSGKRPMLVESFVNGLGLDSRIDFLS